MLICRLRGWASQGAGGEGAGGEGPAPVKRLECRGLTRDDVQVKFVRSGGAGGQNVNKVSTKADIRLNVYDAEWIPEEAREALLEMEANRINNAGELVVASEKTRTQKGNLEDALRKMQKLIEKAVDRVQPKEPNVEKQKRMKKILAKARERKKVDKKRASEKKASRRQKNFD